MSKEHAYAYEAGYIDGSTHYELEHCPACKNIADLQEALAENAKLREQNRYLMKGDLLHVLTDQEYIDQCERERLMQVSIDALDKENAELRELVRDMRTCIGHACMCAFCPLFISEDMNERRCIADMKAHMRELGVDDGTE